MNLFLQLDTLVVEPTHFPYYQVSIKKWFVLKVEDGWCLMYKYVYKYEDEIWDQWDKCFLQSWSLIRKNKMFFFVSVCLWHTFPHMHTQTCTQRSLWHKQRSHRFAKQHVHEPCVVQHRQPVCESGNLGRLCLMCRSTCDLSSGWWSAGMRDRDASGEKCSHSLEWKTYRWSH